MMKKMTNSSRIWTLPAVLVLSIVLGAPPAIAVEIEEVQVVDQFGDPTSPFEFLLIYGTDFSAPPVIFLGTDTTTPLVIPVDQTLCDTAPPPPLDAMGTECVVAELPDPIPCGDYLLSIEGRFPSGSCEVDGKPKALVFEYTGGDCSDTTNLTPRRQGGIVTCSGDPNDAQPVQVECDINQGDCTADPSTASINLNDTVILTASGNSFKGNADIQILSDTGVPLQDLRIHTSCSQPLEVDDVFGSLVLRAFIPEGSDLTSTFGKYDLTVCEPGQGPQGKIGDQGDQGIQGKVGDTGDQGIQGKVGDTGEQGIQGKVGDTGEQGIQGKVGDTGEQGIQGKESDR